MYISWLQQEYPECLPNDLTISTSYSSNTDQSDNGPTSIQSLTESSNQFSVQESSGISLLDVQAPTQSLSISVSQTSLSELSEFQTNQRHL